MNQNMKSETTKTQSKIKDITSRLAVRNLNVPEDICLDVQADHVAFESQRDLLCALIEQHAKDLTDTITGGCIFKSYLKMAAEAKKDWENAKVNMLKQVLGEDKDRLEQWTLDYGSHVLTYVMAVGAKGQTEEGYQYKDIDPAIVKNIQDKHAMYDCVQTVIQTLVEMHANDVADIITPSPVFAGFQNIMIEAKKAFELAKNEMQQTVFTPEERQNMISWNLDYQTCKIKYKLA